MTLKFVFSDGQPMTYGSACSGEGCMQRGIGLEPIDDAGEVLLADRPDRLVEYRRYGVDLGQAPEGTSGRVRADGERATVALPRLLFGSAAAVDAVEADLVSRINAERGVRGLALTRLDTRLSAAADLQATWLNSGAAGLVLPVLSHVGPFGSSLSFRLAEVSFPEPTFGSESLAAAATPADALAMWLGSALHHDQVLAPGALLIGVAAVGNVIVVTTHPPCDVCEPAAPAGAAPGGTLAAPGARALPGGTPAASANAGSGAASCGAEQLRVRRQAGGRVRLRVRVGCLRTGAGYKLTVMQLPSHRIIRTRRISRPGTLTLALRPSRATRTLRVKLKRNGRIVAARSIRRGPPARR